MQVNLFPKVCNAVRAMAECCTKSGTPVAKSEVYNETWLLRMVLACIHDCTEEAFVTQNKKIGDTLKKIHKAVRQQWISEGGLEPAFRQEGTTWTDAILGNVKISGDNKRGVKYEMRDDSTGVIIVEAKMGSELSSGITNSPDYNQAARNIACLAKLLIEQNASPAVISESAFVVLAPRSKLEEWEKDENSPQQLINGAWKTIKDQTRTRNVNCDFDTTFKSMVENIKDNSIALSWDDVIDAIQPNDTNLFSGFPISYLRDFYKIACSEINVNK